MRKVACKKEEDADPPDALLDLHRAEHLVVDTVLGEDAVMDTKCGVSDEDPSECLEGEDDRLGVEHH